MTTEDALQAYLDQHPDEHTARLALADWLDEIGDPRAAGYRALGRNGFYPENENRTWWNYWCHRKGSACNLNEEWWQLFNSVHSWDEPQSRRLTDDDAALAFSRLPLARQEELLRVNQEVPA